MSVTDSSEFKFWELNYSNNDAEYDCLNFKFEIILIDNRYIIIDLMFYKMMIPIKISQKSL